MIVSLKIAGMKPAKFQAKATWVLLTGFHSKLLSVKQ